MSYIVRHQCDFLDCVEQADIPTESLDAYPTPEGWCHLSIYAQDSQEKDAWPIPITTPTRETSIIIHHRPRDIYFCTKHCTDLKLFLGAELPVKPPGPDLARIVRAAELSFPASSTSTRQPMPVPIPLRELIVGSLYRYFEGESEVYDVEIGRHTEGDGVRLHVGHVIHSKMGMTPGHSFTLFGGFLGYRHT